MDRCGETTYEYLGSPSAVYGYTRHSPSGPLIFLNYFILRNSDTVERSLQKSEANEPSSVRKENPRHGDRKAILRFDGTRSREELRCETVALRRRHDRHAAVHSIVPNGTALSAGCRAGDRWPKSLAAKSVQVARSAPGISPETTQVVRVPSATGESVMASNSPEKVFRIGLINASVFKNTIEPKEEGKGQGRSAASTFTCRYYDEKEERMGEHDELSTLRPSGRD